VEPLVDKIDVGNLTIPVSLETTGVTNMVDFIFIDDNVPGINIIPALNETSGKAEELLIVRSFSF
jgi:hypothetical protein